MLKIISLRPLLLLLLTLTLITLGCVAPLDLGVSSTPRPPDAIYLPSHRVLFGSYPRFHTATRVEPPKLWRRPMIPIEPEDEWRVTHVVPDGYFIQSKAYTKRLCQTYGKSWDRGEWGILSVRILTNCLVSFFTTWRSQSVRTERFSMVGRHWPHSLVITGSGTKLTMLLVVGQMIRSSCQ